MEIIDRRDLLAQAGEYVTLATQQISGSSANEQQGPLCDITALFSKAQCQPERFPSETDLHFTRILSNITFFFC